MYFCCFSCADNIFLAPFCRSGLKINFDQNVICHQLCSGFPPILFAFFSANFFPVFFPPSFSLKANVWLRALIYAKLPPRWFNPITFDECYLPSSRHRTSLLAYLFVPTGPGLATLFFLRRLFSKLNVEAVADL